MLVLPDHRVLSLPVLQKLEYLIQQGATVIGYKPEKLISLTGESEAQKTFNEISKKIWGDGRSEKGEKVYGKGKVVWGQSGREYSLSKGIPADFDIVENDSKSDFDYIHYTIGKSDIYFVSNQTEGRKKINARFRVSGKQPELWDALTGEIRKAKAFTQKDGLTTVPLVLEPYGSVMVVFNETIVQNAKGSAEINYPDFKTLKEIGGEWKLSFDTNLGGPASVMFSQLMDWTQRAEEGIKYYSGTAVYNKTFTMDQGLQKGKNYFLALGAVKDVGIAEVRINGKYKGIVWTPPFRVDITKELQQGLNSLEIKVVNSWYNRVAGDQTFPGKKQFTKTNIVLKHDFRGRPIETISLEPSGLLGPVMIQVAE
jgi:hypothetical protein